MIHSSPDKPTHLESFALTPIDDATLEHIVQVFAPFKEVQKALKGKKYVNLPLLPIIIHELHSILDGLLGAVDMKVEPDMFDLVGKILEDFKVRWGDPVVYRHEV